MSRAIGIRTLLSLTFASSLVAVRVARSQALDPPPLFTNSPSRINWWGDDCSADPGGESCISNLCLNVAPFGSVCSIFCGGDDDCTGKDNWGCSQVPQGNGTSVGICRPRRI